nr:interferon alpha-inducible protein 27-like protein 2 [Parasteatoda tepidariorum]
MVLPVLIGAAIGGVCLVALPAAVLSFLGFTGAGVAAGSVAAGIQSGIGNVVAGSVFAFLQSIGATGVSAAASTGFAAIGSALGAVIGFLI